MGNVDCAVDSVNCAMGGNDLAVLSRNAKCPSRPPYQNPFADEERYLYFISDPPHLIKTVGNAWAKQKQNLWVCCFTTLY